MNQGIPLPEERAANSRELNKLHVGNRFRLMFGMPLLPDKMEDECKTEDAVVAMIRNRGQTGRRKYRESMDRADLHPDEWIQHFQEELADGLQYAERMKGATRLLHDARDIMLSILHERHWECAQEWVDRYHEQFFPKEP